MQPIVNKIARHEYEILETYEAGLVLFGHEVKSIKNGLIKLNGAYITVKNTPQQELFLIGAHIPKYNKASNLPDYDPLRSRKILMNKKEISSLIGKIQAGGLTLVPLKVYTKSNLIKVEVGLGKGKKRFDKKASLKNRDLDRDLKRSLKYDR